MTMAAVQQTMTVPEFSRHLGYGRTYAYQLKKEGRLVLDDAGRVLVAESIARIEATKDPSKQGVADRHAVQRDGGEPAADAGEAVDVGGYNYQSSKAKREHYAAEREHALYLKEVGELMDRGQVLAAFANAGAMLRGRMEGMPAMVAPMLMGRDDAGIRAVLADQVEQLLRDISRAFEQAGGEGVD